MEYSVTPIKHNPLVRMIVQHERYGFILLTSAQNIGSK
jgi:hypothetical protein